MKKILERYMTRSKAYKATFESEEGQKVLAFLAEEAGQFRTSHVAGDPYATAFNEGKRHMFNHIMGIINQDEKLIRHALQAEQEQAQLAMALAGE